MLDKVLEFLRWVPAPLVIAAAFLLPAAETALWVGLVIPGEVIVVCAGILAARAHVPIAAVVAAAVAGSIVGDTIGYFVGKRFQRSITKRLFSKRRSRAREWLQKKGLVAIFLARFTPFLRSVMPAAAGAAKVKYRSFALWNYSAGLLWGAGSALLGYYAGSNAEGILRWASGAAVLILVLVVLATTTIFLHRRQRRRRRQRT